MSEKIYWIDPVTHWKAFGIASGEGIKDAHVNDGDGATRTYSKSFDSKEDFFKWARKEAARPM